MAGETSAELTIVVRAQDAATKVINGIGRTIGRVLMTPLNAVGKAFAGIFKQMFGLKSLLVGGGIIAAVNGLTQSLAKAAEKYEPIFSAATQSKIDDTASAFNKLGASLKQTFATLVVDFDLAGKLNALSDWLRDNQSTIVKSFKDMADTVRAVGDAFNYAKGLAKGFFMAVGDAMWGPNGIDPQSRRAAEPFRVPGTVEDNPIASGGTGPGDLPPELDADWSKFYENVSRVRKETDAMRAESRQTVEIVQKVAVANEAAAESYRHVAESVAVTTHQIAELTPIIEGYLTVGEAAESVSSHMTDAFEDIIRGTQSVGRAFGLMVSSILGELGRLLVQRSLLNLLVSVGSSLFGSIGAGTTQSGSLPGAATSSGVPAAGFRGGFASGGPVRQSGIVRVGENGPENEYLPRGSRVEASQRSRDNGGGDTYNIIGARDPKATAREVAYERRRSASLRRALA